MTVKQLIEECNIDMWQHIVVKKNRTTLGGGFRNRIIKRYGSMVIDSIWCVEGCIFIRVV